MWNKPSQPSTPSRASSEERPNPRQAASTGSGRSRIGAGLLIQGEVRGQEDVVVEGRVEGKIVLEENTVVVEKSGRIQADVKAKQVRVAGEVRGNIHASEQAVLLETARLEGNVVAKSVTIETGASFTGSIDMGADKPAEARPSQASLESAEVPSKPNGAVNPVGVS